MKVSPNSGEANILAIAQKLKKRLNVAEDELKANAIELAKYRSIGGLPSGMGNSAELESELRDTKFKLQQLQMQHEALVSKTSSSGLTYRKNEEHLEETTAQLKELKRVLEQVKHEKEIADIKADRTEALEEEVRRLNVQNRNLEEEHRRLCEAPFINDAYGQARGRANVDELIRTTELQAMKVEQFTKALQTKEAIMITMKKEMVALTEEKDEAQKIAEEFRAKYNEIQSDQNVLQEKLKLYSGDDGLSVEELERALTVVKRRGEAVSKLEFLDDPEGGEGLTIPVMKRKLHDVQVINLNLTKEVERLENMLKLQSTISKDLHKELEILVRKGENEKRELIGKNNQLEALGMKRQEKIKMLEAQLRQHIYTATSNSSVKSRGVGTNPLEMTTDTSAGAGDMHNDLLSELINENDGPVRPDENLMEVWVKSGDIADKILAPGSSTFVVIDFFDYESQATALVSGSRPQWDFAATFKIKVDDFFIRYFATDTVVFELNMVVKGDFRMIARCSLPLRDLLRTIPRMVMDSCPMISPDTGEVCEHRHNPVHYLHIPPFYQFL